MHIPQKVFREELTIHRHFVTAPTRQNGSFLTIYSQFFTIYINTFQKLRFKQSDWEAEQAPPHVLWQVSFGWWFTWSISSWQKCYKSVFFFNFTKLQFLKHKIYSYTENNYLALGNLVFWSISSFKTKRKHLPQFCETNLFR